MSISVCRCQRCRGAGFPTGSTGLKRAGFWADSKGVDAKGGQRFASPELLTGRS